MYSGSASSNSRLKINLVILAARFYNDVKWVGTNDIMRSHSMATVSSQTCHEVLSRVWLTGDGSSVVMAMSQVLSPLLLSSSQTICRKLS